MYTLHTNVIDYLHKYGYHNLLDVKVGELQRIDNESTSYKQMMAHYQSYFWHDKGIQPDGVIGSITRAMMEKPRCGCLDVKPGNYATISKWAEPCSKKLKVFANLNRLKTNSTYPTTEAYNNAWYEQFKETQRVCNTGYEIVDSASESHYDATSGRTSGSVLAWSEFPSSCNGNSDTLFGSSWNWNRNLFVDTALHETGHGWGLDHGPAGNVMFWTVDGQYKGVWQKWDTAQLVKRYGKPVKPEPTGPIPDKIIDQASQLMLQLVVRCAVTDGIAATKKRMLNPTLREQVLIKKEIQKLSKKDFAQYGDRISDWMMRELKGLDPFEVDYLVQLASEDYIGI